ncbi:hypothetical protein [Phytoactinopolyspora mesophila]|uniref:Uncharacterized protein n=1 Tax=Phytoactinopolyspora mesophila TaxID=2650750 RepID=A0A7K3M228_9ACTN|nr:hypothetical protein [Phytoactinopolyspora mesophila]NDL57343.1 hypothetical protein [Phytoactinopolyspora mesophila]
MAPRLELVAQDNVRAACALQLEDGQDRFVASVAHSLAETCGQSRITVLWVEHPEGPEQFYLRSGFIPTGQKFHGQIVGERFV